MANRIMIIDDAESMRQVVNLLLSNEGYEVVEACDGEDALSKLDGSEIDMFICDVNMPNMDGFTFLHNLKNDERYSDYRFSPVVMLTTEISDEAKNKGKNLGAKAWVVKPFQPDKLLDVVKKILR